MSPIARIRSRAGEVYSRPSHHSWTKSRRAKRSYRRRGFTATELIVAATLLVSVISVVTPLAVRSGRLRQDARHYRLALDELSNHLDRLTALDEASLDAALEEPSPSDHIQDALSSPKLTAKLFDDANGRRITLSLSWNRPGNAKPVSLTAWLVSAPANAEEPAP